MEEPTTTSPADPGGPRSGVWKVARVPLGILGWVPLILAGAVPDYRVAVTSALGVALFNQLCIYALHRLTGFPRIWPRTLDSIFTVLFLALTIAAWADQSRDEEIEAWTGFVINGGLFLGATIAGLSGHSFIKDEMASNERFTQAQLSHPVLLHTTRVMLWLWLGVFGLMALVSLVGGVRDLFEPKPSSQFVYAFSNPAYLTFVVLIAGGAATGLYTWRMRADRKFVTAIASRYQRELEAWAEANPEDPWAKLKHEEDANTLTSP